RRRGAQSDEKRSDLPGERGAQGGTPESHARPPGADREASEEAARRRRRGRVQVHRDWGSVLAMAVSRKLAELQTARRKLAAALSVIGASTATTHLMPSRRHRRGSLSAKPTRSCSQRRRRPTLATPSGWPQRKKPPGQRSPRRRRTTSRSAP